jgi:hypothetical protein
VADTLALIVTQTLIVSTGMFPVMPAELKTLAVIALADVRLVIAVVVVNFVNAPIVLVNAVDAGLWLAVLRARMSSSEQPIRWAGRRGVSNATALTVFDGEVKQAGIGARRLGVLLLHGLVVHVNGMGGGFAVLRGRLWGAASLAVELLHDFEEALLVSDILNSILRVVLRYIQIRYC